MHSRITVCAHRVQDDKGRVRHQDRHEGHIPFYEPTADGVEATLVVSKYQGTSLAMDVSAVVAGAGRLKTRGWRRCE